MYLLDTNHCSQIIAGNRQLAEQLSKHRKDGVATSVIVQGELYYMVQKSQYQSENLEVVNSFLQKVSLYPINSAIAEIYGKMKGDIVDYFGPRNKAQRRKITTKALGFGDNDLWIAATALNYNLTIVSADQDFQRLQEIQPILLESWI